MCEMVILITSAFVESTRTVAGRAHRPAEDVVLEKQAQMSYSASSGRCNQSTMLPQAKTFTSKSPEEGL